jgi:hypothetical protein
MAIRDVAISPSTILGVHLANLLSMIHVVRQVGLLTPLQVPRFQWDIQQVLSVLKSFQRLRQHTGRLVLQLKLVGL